MFVARVCPRLPPFYSKVIAGESIRIVQAHSFPLLGWAGFFFVMFGVAFSQRFVSTPFVPMAGVIEAVALGVMLFFVLASLRVKTFRIDTRLERLEVASSVLGIQFQSEQHPSEGFSLRRITLAKSYPWSDSRGYAIIVKCRACPYVIACDREPENLRRWYSSTLEELAGRLDEAEAPALFGLF